MQPTFGGYLGLLFGPFFRWWWTLITGVASILSFTITPPEGLSMTRHSVALMTLGTFALLFLTLSALAQSWALYKARFVTLEVVALQKCHDYGGDFIVLLRGQLPTTRGMLVDIRRRIGDVEAPFALVEIIDRNVRGTYQAKPVTISAGHLKDFAAGKFVAGELVAYPYVDAERIRASADDFKLSEPKA